MVTLQLVSMYALLLCISPRAANSAQCGEVSRHPASHCTQLSGQELRTVGPFGPLHSPVRAQFPQDRSLSVHIVRGAMTANAVAACKWSISWRCVYARVRVLVTYSEAGPVCVYCMLPSFHNLSISCRQSRSKKKRKADECHTGEQYKVDCILDRYRTNKDVYYYLKWKDFADGEDAWQISGNATCDLIVEYEKENGELKEEEDGLTDVQAVCGDAFTFVTKKGHEVLIATGDMMQVTLNRVEVYRQRNAKFLVWDTNTASVRLSLTLALRNGNFDVECSVLWKTLLEWTITRLWLLKTVAPPHFITKKKIQQVAQSCYDIKTYVGKKTEKKEKIGKQAKIQKQAEIQNLVDDLRGRWGNRTKQKEIQSERLTLLTQLVALREIGKLHQFVSPYSSGLQNLTKPKVGRAEVIRLVNQWDPNVYKKRCFPEYSLPAARSNSQNGFIRYRNAETDRFLQWMKRQWYEKEGCSGSVYDGSIPPRFSELSVVQGDHTVPKSWCKNTELLEEFCCVNEDMNNIIMVPSQQNLKKGAKPVRFVSDSPHNPNKACHTLFSPDLTTFKKMHQKSVAVRIFCMFLSNPLITEHSDVRSAIDQQCKGCSYYADTTVHEHMLELLKDNIAPPDDRHQNLVILYLFRSYNPLLETPSLLHSVQEPLAPLFTELLRQRLQGETSLPTFCGAALKSAVFGFPG